MREFQMKKIIATAVAMAFAAPVMAADITITGDQEFSWQTNNGATTASLDGDFNVKASTETAGGFSVSADINISEEAGDDGSASLTVSGPFGSVDLGDTSSAVDAVDDTTDWGYVLTSGSANYDAAVLWTLPSVVSGLSLYVSAGADATDGAADGRSGTGVSFKYSAGDLSVRYGVNSYDDTGVAATVNEVSIVAATYSMAGFSVAAETMTTTTEAGTEVDTELFGATYTTGDLTLAVETLENGGTNDILTVGAHYSLGGGVTAFVEQSTDDIVTTADTTAVGVTMTF